MTAPVPPAAAPTNPPVDNDDEMEEGELSDRDPGSLVIPAFKSRRRARECNDDDDDDDDDGPTDDDFWDDSEVIAAWDSVIDRWRRMQRGEPVSDSDDEDEEHDEDGEVDEDEPCGATVDDHDDDAALSTTDETEGQLDRRSRRWSRMRRTCRIRCCTVFAVVVLSRNHGTRQDK
ncbi:hypothetical protein AMAG_20239 [Allomyces macrogynus ATCC 38327]|uniref:Uncharacterized protein n=1 Tax=Allomyces macrogynus (strain ATCC 38327) TaxID=578462 RepID=A0A0L0T5P1_ALLM3|nr:hypothetical protein AMAG_20239 [Allomyces macrogynus ATCC 38327]|eukprot:KNE70108.1 hypothetical protein AMAG_20239 [Allomyces macrogynus ATCC 38327]